MPASLTETLIFTSIVVGVLCFLSIRNYLGLWTSFVVASVRVLVPFVYFSWYYDRTWNIADDLLYSEAGKLFLARGYTPFSLIFHPQARDLLRDSLNGVISYGWYNVLAQYLIAPHYYAPVFLNVLMTFLAARPLYRIARREATPRYARLLTLFFLIQWDVIAWSSLLNVKDLLVMVLTIFSIEWLLNLHDGQKLYPLLNFAIMLPVFAGLRFYTPVLLFASFATWEAIESVGIRRLFFAAAGGSGVLVIVGSWGWANTLRALSYYAPTLTRGHYLDYLTDVAHFLLNPRPWSLTPAYTFLLIPSILHWLTLPIATIGAIVLWRRQPVAKFLIIYFAVTVLLYSATTLENGIRFRLQLDFILAWFQFQGIWALLPASFQNEGSLESNVNPAYEPVGNASATID